MGVKRCAYPRCRSDSRYYKKDYMSGVKFFPFPKPISKPVICKKWLAWLKEVRKDFSISKITENTYICNKHFVDNSGPTLKHPNPIHNHKKTTERSLMVSILKPVSKSDCEDALLNINPPLCSPIMELDTDNDDLTNIPQSMGKPEEIGTLESEIVELIDDNLTRVEKSETLILKFKDFFYSDEWFSSEKSGWFLSLTNELLQLLRINERTGSVAIRLIVKPDYTYSLSVLNQTLDSNNFITLPEKITDSVTLLSVLKDLDNLNVCNGNGEDEIVQLLKEKQRGYFSWNTGSQHDEKCTRLTNKKICANCSLLRSYALQAISRRKKRKQFSKELRVEKLTECRKGETKKNEHECFEELVNKSQSQGESEEKTNFVSLFLRTQLKMCNQPNSHGRRWHPSIIKWCLYQYRKSPAAYNSLVESNILKLPSYSTLFRHSSEKVDKDVESHPGKL